MGTNTSTDTDPWIHVNFDLNVWKKFTIRGSKPNNDTFPELADCVIWVRAIIGLWYGITLGTQDSHGALGVLLGVSLLTFVPNFYVELYLQADTDSYSMLTFKGVPNAFALMILVWIVCFTANHPTEEATLASFLVQPLVDADTDTLTDTLTDTASNVVSETVEETLAAVVEEAATAVEDTEF